VEWELCALDVHSTNLHQLARCYSINIGQHY